MTDERETRPDAWDAMYRNEMELAKANYKEEEERYKVIIQKANTVFAIMGLAAALGLTKFQDIFPVLGRLPTEFAYPALAALLLAFVLLGIAVYLNLDILTTRTYEGISSSGEYVGDVCDADADKVDRALSSIYQTTADINSEVNDVLVERLGHAIKCIKWGAIMAFVFFLIYGVGTWRYPM